MEDGLPGACITHGGREDGQLCPVFGIIVIQKHLVAPDAHVRRDIIAFRLANKGMQEYAIHNLQSAFLDIFMGAVYGVTGLEADYALPALFHEQRPGINRV